MKKLAIPKPKKFNKTKAKVCPVCKKEFTSKSTDRRGWLWAVAKYCSVKCAGIGRQTREKRNCKVCKKEYMFMPSQLRAYKGAGQFCSKKCHGDWDVIRHRDIPTKDKWGRTGRRDDQEWKMAVRERDNFTCKRCGKFEKYIHTHHIATRARRPDLKHEVNNGVCLCGSCHQWVHWHPKEAALIGLLSDEKYETRTI